MFWLFVGLGVVVLGAAAVLSYRFPHERRAAREWAKGWVTVAVVVAVAITYAILDGEPFYLVAVAIVLLLPAVMKIASKLGDRRQRSSSPRERPGQR